MTMLGASMGWSGVRRGGVGRSGVVGSRNYQTTTDGSGFFGGTRDRELLLCSRDVPARIGEYTGWPFLEKFSAFPEHRTTGPAGARRCVGHSELHAKRPPRVYTDSRRSISRIQRQLSFAGASGKIDHREWCTCMLTPSSKTDVTHVK